MSFSATGLSHREIVERCLDPLRSRLGARSLWVMLICVGVIAHGLVAWVRQVEVGLGVAGYAPPVYWGVYIVTFVFWIGVAHAGALISAVLRLSGAEWRSSITRLAEVLTLFTLPAAACFPLIHLGRVGVCYYMLPYPNQRLLWPNFRSPLVWDLFAIGTYLVGSVLFLYVTMLPDLGLLRARFATGWRGRLYARLACGWRGTSEEWRRLKEAANLFSVLLLPVVVSVHTVVAWDFATQLVPGWHASVFGPLFLAGALFSGVAAVVTLMALLKWSVPAFGPFFKDAHFEYIGRIWLVLGLAWGYLYFNELLPGYYAHDADRGAYEAWLAHGRFSLSFWGMLLCNVVLPVACLGFRRFRRRVLPMFLLSLATQAGMYLERVNIVVAGLEVWNPLARNTALYVPSYTEVSLLLASVAGVVLGILLFTRVFPILPVWELLETESRHEVREVAGRTMHYFRSGE